jgi:hypothetical protein
MVFLEDLGRRGPSTVERGISKTLLIVRGYPGLPEKWPSPCVRPKKITMIARERTAQLLERDSLILEEKVKA